MLLKLVMVIYLLAMRPSVIFATEIYLSEFGAKATQEDDKLTALRNVQIINEVLKSNKGSRNTIILPIGIVWFASPIIIPSGITLKGNPLGSTLAVSASFSSLNEGFLVNENFVLYKPEGDSNIVLSDFEIRGSLLQPQDVHSRGIYFNKVNTVVLNNLTINDTWAEGIRFDVSLAEGKSKDIAIENCVIQRSPNDYPNIMLRSYTQTANNEENVPSRISSVIIRGNRSSGGAHNIHLFNVSHASIAVNTCISGRYRGIILGPTCNNIKIYNNIVKNAGSTGIHLAYRCNDIYIDSNTVTGTIADMSGIGQEGQGIKAYAGFSKVYIRGNICNENATDGIALEGGGASENFLISGNRCDNNKRNGIRLMAGKISLQKGFDMENGEVNRNQLFNNSEDAIYIGSDNEGKNTVKKVKLNKNLASNPTGKQKVRVAYPNKTIIVN